MLLVQHCRKYPVLACVMYPLQCVIIRLIWGFKTPYQPPRLCGGDYEWWRGRMLVKAVMAFLICCWLVEVKSEAIITCQVRNTLTPWSVIFLKNIIFAQLNKKSPHVACPQESVLNPWPYAYLSPGRNECCPRHFIPFNISFNIILPYNRRFSTWSLCLIFRHSNINVSFSSLACVPHSLPV